MVESAISGPASTSRVLIVDDHPILRHGIAQLIQREPDFDPCGEASTIDEALVIMAAQPIDLLVVDLSLGDDSGMELIRVVRDRYPAARCLVLSMHDERLYAERVLRAGARGYLMKQEATKKIVTALRCIRDGRIYLSDGLANQVLERLAGPGSSGAGDAASPLAGLTDRELEVMQLIGQGLKTGEIAKRLHRSVHTVEAHRASIKRKLGVRTSAELAQAAFQSLGGS